MKKLYVKFEYKTDIKSEVQVYEKEIQFPEKPPMPFHAIDAMAFHIHWEEKNVLKSRIIELENILKQNGINEK